MLIDASDSEAAISSRSSSWRGTEARSALQSRRARVHEYHTRQGGLRRASEATQLDPMVAEHYIDLAMLCLEHENYDLALEIVDID